MSKSTTEGDVVRDMLKSLSLIVAFLANLVLAVGVASTVVDLVPQPSMNTVELAFGVLLFALGLFVLRLLVLLFVVGTANPVAGLALTAVFGVVVVPSLFVLYTAASTVWETLPAQYAVRTSFLFLLGSLFSGTLAGDGNT
ncbi:hypothetical protein RYH80_13230 [Halobaculum sp. MBLA0147]|uniref:hypothetical protein n=1 Tax=Halobaculum sp. MBLA0147 TaxID=3079934 RepID=UPI003526690E